MRKIYKSKEWFFDNYVTKRKSAAVIGKELGCSYVTVMRWLSNFDIPHRSISEALIASYGSENALYHNKLWLLDQYWGNEKPTKAIGQEYSYSVDPIRNHMREYNIPRRSSGLAISLAKSHHCDLSQEALEFIEGEMLGDMHITKPSGCSALIKYGSQYKEYIKYLSGTLSDYGVCKSGNIITNRNYSVIHNKSYTLYNYCSLSYLELLELHKKWYVPFKGKSKGNRRKWFKIIPRDLELTPLVCRQWYIGDGCLVHHKSERDYICLATNGFRKKDVLFLVKKLNEVGFRVTRMPASNSIKISTRSTKDFLDYIGKCPISCYRYKWDYRDGGVNKRRRRFEILREYAVELYEGGLTSAQVKEVLGHNVSAWLERSGVIRDKRSGRYIYLNSINN